METVNFQCGQCGKLMAVGSEFLGQQVRCPHCQTVVLAPGRAPAAATPPAPEPPQEPCFQTAGAEEHDSIFGPPEAASDDLFGDSGHQPVVEMPAAPAWPNLQIKSAAPPAETESLQPYAPASVREAQGQGDRAWQPVQAVASPPSAEAEPPSAAAQPRAGEPAKAPALLSPDSSETRPAAAEGTLLPPAGGEWSAAGETEAGVNLTPELTPPLSSRPVHARRAPGGLLPVVLLIFLIPYSILATAAAVYFYYQRLKTPHPLETLPDLQGNKPGATRKSQTSTSFERVKPDTDLPARLRVPLRGAIRIGDLQVTPQHVQRRRVVYLSDAPGANLLESQDEALVLTLHLRNISKDVYFVPTDPFFWRQWREGESARLKPYTFLEIGDKRFYGGPIRWEPRTTGEYLKGQENDDKVLAPGEERTTLVCTDPDNPDVLKALKGYQAPLLWRVELRRGLVEVSQKEVSACAVIGVEFNPKDIETH